MVREVELFFKSVIDDDRNVLDLMDADYTFVNERLAKHYGIPDIYGSQFRRVSVTDERRGLLGKGAILMATSHAHRSSPVLRGKWVLENIIGVSPTPPPDDVPALNDEERPDKPRSVREAMEAHRASPVCASCHRVLDPIGFALENFDAVGAWRARDGGTLGDEIDASGQLIDGTRVDGAVALRQALVREPEVFVRTLTEKLLTYAVGRGLTAADMPVVRSVVPRCARQELSLLVPRARDRAQRTVPDAHRGRAGVVNHTWRPGPAGPLRGANDVFITKRSLSRRMMLKGMGATVALPFLDAMVPAATALAKTAAQPALRFGAVFVPMGERPGHWTPVTTGRGFEFSPILKPIERLRESLVVVSNLDRPPGGTHAVSTSTWLTGAAPKRTEAETSTRAFRWTSSPPVSSARRPCSRPWRLRRRIRPATSAHAMWATAAPT